MKPEQYQLSLLPSIIAAASQNADGSYSCPERTQRRLDRATLAVERGKDGHHRTEAERFRADDRAGQMLALSTPLHIVEIEHGDEQESYLCAMSPGAIADWLAEYVNPRHADGSRHSNRLHVVERDTGNHGYRVPMSTTTLDGELAATRAHQSNRSGMSRLQSAFRAARLDSSEPLPATRERRAFYGPDNSTPEAICYRALFDGSLRELCYSEDARDSVVSYLFDALDGAPAEIYTLAPM